MKSFCWGAFLFLIIVVFKPGSLQAATPPATTPPATTPPATTPPATTPPATTPPATTPPATTPSSAPVINNKAIVTNLYDDTKVQTEVGCVDCTSPGGKEIKVTKVSITPASPCGECFAIYNFTEKYCAYYLPSQGKLSYSEASVYKIAVECSDLSEKDTATIEVRIRTNEAPQITPGTTGTCSMDARKDKKGKVIYNSITATDPDGDTLYYTLTTDPASDNFEIGEHDGIITAKNDLDSECRSEIKFRVNVTDKKHDPVGPVVITCDITKNDVPPTISDVNKDISQAENMEVGSTLVKFDTSPAPEGYEISTIPASAQSLFTVDGNELKLAQKLNYENRDEQFINITIKAKKGKCEPIVHYLYLEVKDANDPPVLGPKIISKTVWEGGITVNPQFTVTDEDYVDSHKYEILTGNDKGYFTIDPSTGVISSTIKYDVDQKAMPDKVSLFVQVKDTKGQAVDNATVNLFIRDYNDNAPVFKETAYAYTVSECASVGKTLAKQALKASDDVDSDLNGNNDVYIADATNGVVSVRQDGSVILVGTQAAGTTSTLTVYAKDRGKVPGPQTSLVPATVTVSFTPCPTKTPVVVPPVVVPPVVVPPVVNPPVVTTPAPVTPAPTTPAPVTPAPTTVVPTKCSGILCDTGNLAWMIFAGLLGLALLGLLGLMIYRFCCPCRNPCGSFCQKTPQPRHIKPFTPETPIRKKKFVPDPAPQWVYQGSSVVYQPTPPATTTMVAATAPVMTAQRMIRTKRLVPATALVGQRAPLSSRLITTRLLTR